MCCGFMYFMAKWLDVYMFIMVCVFGFTTVIQLYHILMFFFPSSIWWGGGKKSLKSTLPKNKDEINKQNRFISQEKNLLCLKWYCYPSFLLALLIWCVSLWHLFNLFIPFKIIPIFSPNKSIILAHFTYLRSSLLSHHAGIP